jgi:hypothetical protein
MPRQFLAPNNPPGSASPATTMPWFGCSGVADSGALARSLELPLHREHGFEIRVCHR